jgi:hypothetical protein
MEWWFLSRHFRYFLPLAGASAWLRLYARPKMSNNLFLRKGGTPVAPRREIESVQHLWNTLSIRGELSGRNPKSALAAHIGISQVRYLHLHAESYLCNRNLVTYQLLRYLHPLIDRLPFNRLSVTLVSSLTYVAPVPPVKYEHFYTHFGKCGKYLGISRQPNQQYVDK